MGLLTPLPVKSRDLHININLFVRLNLQKNMLLINTLIFIPLQRLL